MRLAFTTHAAERWSTLTDPPIDWPQAYAEMKVACAATTAREHVGRTRRGQPVYRVDAPREAFLVVVRKEEDPRVRNPNATHADGVVVTVLPRELWEHGPSYDPARELLDAWDERREWLPSPPAGHRLRGPTPTVAKSWPPPESPPVPAPEAALRGAVTGDALPIGGADEVQRADWRSYLWTIAAIERERRMAEHFRIERERVLEQHEVLAAAFRLATGRGTIDELVAAFEVARPGAIEAARAKRGT